MLSCVPQWVSQAGTFFPLRCPECPEHPGGHWTLLSLGLQEAVAEVTVRYYESMAGMHRGFPQQGPGAAELVCDAPLVRTTTFRPDGADGVFWVLHYAEFEAREDC